MKRKKNTNQSKSIDEMLDLICYNLAQYQYLAKRYQLVQNLTDFDTFLNIATERTQQDAQIKRYQLGELKKKINQEKNPLLKKYYEMEVEPYEIFTAMIDGEFIKKVDMLEEGEA